MASAKPVALKLKALVLGSKAVEWANDGGRLLTKLRLQIDTDAKGTDAPSDAPERKFEVYLPIDKARDLGPGDELEVILKRVSKCVAKLSKGAEEMLRKIHQDLKALQLRLKKKLSDKVKIDKAFGVLNQETVKKHGGDPRKLGTKKYEDYDKLRVQSSEMGREVSAMRQTEKELKESEAAITKGE